MNGILISTKSEKFDKTVKNVISKKTGEILTPDVMANRFVVRQYTKTHPGMPNFKRRFNYFVIVPENYAKLKNLAYVEYGGIDTKPGSSLLKHKNARPNGTAGPYIRQSEAPKEKATIDIENGMKLINFIMDSEIMYKTL